MASAVSECTLNFDGLVVRVALLEPGEPRICVQHPHEVARRGIPVLIAADKVRAFASMDSSVALRTTDSPIASYGSFAAA